MYKYIYIYIYFLYLYYPNHISQEHTASPSSNTNLVATEAIPQLTEALLP